MAATSSGQTLSGRHWLRAQVGFAGLVKPQGHLAFGHHPARRDHIDADALCAQLTRQTSGKAVHRGLGRGIDRVSAGLGLPAGGPEIDDGAATQASHARHHCLDREERRPLVDRHTPVPVVGRHFMQRMTLVAGHVVDQHVEIAQCLRRVGNARCSAGISATSQQPNQGRSRPSAARRSASCAAGVFGNIHERHAARPAVRRPRQWPAPMPLAPPVTNTRRPAR